MNAESVTLPASKLRQFAACFALSMRRFSGSKFMLANLFFAACPIGISLVIVFFSPALRGSSQFSEVHNIYEGLLRLTYLHFIIFFIAFIFGFSVMRQDREDQTLHYLLLQPVDRWMLVAAKFLAYVVLAFGACAASLWITYLILGVPRFGVSQVATDLFQHGRFLTLIKETGVLLIGLVAYGAVALLMSSFFNSALFAMILLAWEAGLPYVPSALKLWSVSHYLHSLLPERIMKQRKLFELLGDPTSWQTSVSVLIVLSATFVILSAIIFQNRECLYGTDG